MVITKVLSIFHQKLGRDCNVLVKVIIEDSIDVDFSRTIKAMKRMKEHALHFSHDQVYH